MALTGILFGAVVIMWAVFLVPWALRRYDEATSARPIETFSDAMRVLARLHPESKAPADTGPSQAQPGAASDASGASVRRPSRAAARAATVRRRRVLMILLGAALVVAVLVTARVVPVWALAVPAGLIVGWLVLCRVQVRGEHQAAAARPRVTRGAAPADETTTVRISTAPAAPIAVPEVRAPDREQDDAPVSEQPLEQVDVPVSEQHPEEAPPVAVPAPVEGGSSLWDPVPVTLPTYVSKPRATRSIRTIDLSAPDTWTSGHVAGEQTEMPVKAADDEHRRAVGD